MSKKSSSRTKSLRSRTFLRFVIITSTVLVLVAGFLLFADHNPVEADGKRIVILGFDGMDINLVSRFMVEGHLPNLARLRDEGELATLMSTIPPESPVAWSSFITGTNPGKTGVFDFLRRNPETYFPELNMTNVIEPPKFLFNQIPYAPPVLENARKGKAFWTYAAEAGIPTIGVMMPMNMPPDEFSEMRVLSGLGVPDLRKTMGTYVFYVDDKTVAEEKTGSTEGTEMGGNVEVVTREGNEIDTIIKGPYVPIPGRENEQLVAQIGMTVDPDAKTLEFRIHNETPFMFVEFIMGLIVGLIVFILAWIILARIFKSNSKGVGTALLILIIWCAVLGIINRPTSTIESETITEGTWSEWMPVKFKMTNFYGLVGFTRVYFIEAEPNFQVYATPICIDPRETKGANISFPPTFANGLLDKYGKFKTYGWDSETWALNENVLPEEVYMEDLLENWDIKSNMVVELMKDDDWQLFSAVFQGTDHVQHMFWRFIDKEHPMYDMELDEQFGDSVLEVYKKADDLVGRIMDEILDEDDELIVMSDHGFNTWTKSVNINRWLIDNGYLVEKPQAGGHLARVTELFDKNLEFFQWVNWSDSRAYALGLGQIYINLEGRESEGIVTENEKDALIDEIIEGLLEMTDPDTGLKILVNAYRADEIYHGDNMEYSPDIVVGFAPGYRVSWQTCLGVAAEDLIEINMKKWSGDHCSLDRSAARGVLFSTVPLTIDDPELIDVTPSILTLFGIEYPERCDGRQIF